MNAYFAFQKRLVLSICLCALPLLALAWSLSHSFAEAFLVGLLASFMGVLLKFRLARQTLREIPSTLPWYSITSLTLYAGALYGSYKVHASPLEGLIAVSSALGLVTLIMFVFGLTEIDLLGTSLHSSAVSAMNYKEED